MNLFRFLKYKRALRKRKVRYKKWYNNMYGMFLASIQKVLAADSSDTVFVCNVLHRLEIYGPYSAYRIPYTLEDLKAMRWFFVDLTKNINRVRVCSEKEIDKCIDFFYPELRSYFTGKK